jgi:hypothetical protein
MVTDNPYRLHRIQCPFPIILWSGRCINDDNNVPAIAHPPAPNIAKYESISGKSSTALEEVWKVRREEQARGIGRVRDGEAGGYCGINFVSTCTVPRAKELDRSAVQTDGGYLIRLSLIVGWYGGVAGGRS